MEWNNDNVKSTRGLRQGCTLSPLLFTLIMEELTQRIKNREVGIKVGEGKLSVLLFADDVVLLTDNLDEMLKLLGEIDKFSEDMEMKFAIDKCKAMIINGKENEIQNKKLKLSGMELEIVEEYKYLGVKLDTKGMDKENNGLRKKAEKMFGIINGKTNLRANKFQVIRGLWKGLAVPTIMYGLEVIDANGKEKKGLEIVQNKAARKGLRANRHVAIEALRGEMGWSTFEERIDKAKINYRIRLEHMDEKKVG